MDTIVTPVTVITLDSTKIVHSIKADLVARYFPPVVRLVQYDQSLPVIAVSLMQNGQAYTLPSGAAANIRVHKPDATYVYNPALGCDSTRNIVYFEVTQAMAAANGDGLAIVEIVVDGDIAGTSLITLHFEENPVPEDAIESSDEWETIYELGERIIASTVTPVSTAAGMTDHNVVYLYTGTESGWNQGHMYYYNGTTWVDAGIAVTDTTLSVAGLAADAKKTGDEIATVKDGLSDEQAIIGNYGETFKNVSYFPRINDLFVVEDDVLTLERNTGGSNWVTASFPVSIQHKFIILVESDNALEICSYKFTATNATASGDINGTRFNKKAIVESTTNNFLRLFFQITSSTPDTTITVHVLDITDTIADSVAHISTVLQPVNLLDIAKATDGYYVNYSSGNLSSNSNFLASDFVPVEPDNYYTLSVYTASYGVGQMAWYDAKKAYISGLANGGINTSVSVKAPTTARYLRWSINKAIKDSTQLQMGKISTPYTTTEYKIPSKYIPVSENYVTVGIGGTYRTILQALKDTDDKIKVKVMYGTYNLVQEYTDYYGSNFWTNYAGYASSDDPFMRGLWITNGREIEFDQRAIVTFLPNIENANIASYFSPFAIGYNAKITGLTLQYSGCRYAVHDDFATAPGKNEYINCHFDGNPASGAVIGAGCGSNNTYIVDGCVFINNEGTYDISYHNGSGSYNKNLIVVKNCYGTQKCSFRWYGNSTQITDCIVSASKFGTIECVPHSYTPNDKVNMKLYSFCNEVGWLLSVT